MRINHLLLQNFRNYSELKLSFDDNINIFIGDNAQGKTNILEAIYVGAMGKSHRTNTDQEMVYWDYDRGAITIGFSRMDVENELHLHLSAQQTKQIKLNGHSIRPKELIGNINAVLFSPEDLMLIKGLPVGRRKFLDTEISQANPVYYRNLHQYNHLLQQRNNLLKKIRENNANIELLQPWDNQLSAMAAGITKKRREAVKKLTMLANLMHRKITDNKENLAIVYQHNGMEEWVEESKLTDWYGEQLLKIRQQDVYRGSTGIGPHRDDLLFLVNNINLKTYGSQGQQRTGVLALKLAELEYIKSETGEYPVLLLDDVMSELDESRREQLIQFIKERIQTFITATEKKYFPSGSFGKYRIVKNGEIRE